MKIDVCNLLPEELSDESAYHLVTFFTNLTAELESHYFAQMRRYVNDNMPSDLTDALQDQIDEEIPF